MPARQEAFGAYVIDCVTGHISRAVATPAILDSVAGWNFNDGDLRLEFVELADHPVHKVPAYRFRMLHAQTERELGGINLRLGSTPHILLYAGHVGYTVHPLYRRHRYAARSLRLLIPFAESLGCTTLWITCDPDNLSSRRTAELAGAKFVEIVDVPADCVIHQSGHKQKCRYRLDIGPGPN